MANKRRPMKGGDPSSHHCTAHSSRTGKPCQKAAIAGGTVCSTHGGRAPQVKEAARVRLALLVDPAIGRLGELIKQTENSASALGAVNSVLDRAGYPKTDQLAIGLEAAVALVDPEKAKHMSTAEIRTLLPLLKKLVGQTD